MSPEVMKALVDMGGTVVVVVLFLVFTYRLVNRLFPQFITTQQDIAKAMGQQAESMGQMKDTVREFVLRDNSEHREIILGLRVVGQELKTLVEQVARLK